MWFEQNCDPKRRDERTSEGPVTPRSVRSILREYLRAGLPSGFPSTAPEGLHVCYLCGKTKSPVRVNHKVSTTGDGTRTQGDVEISNFPISLRDGLVIDVSFVCEFKGSNRTPEGWNNGVTHNRLPPHGTMTIQIDTSLRRCNFICTNRLTSFLYLSYIFSDSYWRGSNKIVNQKGVTNEPSSR